MRTCRSFSRILFLQGISRNEDFQSAVAQFPLCGQSCYDAFPRMETTSTMGYIYKTRFLQSTNSFGRSWWLWDLRMSHLHWTTQHHHSPTFGLGNIKKRSQPRFWHGHFVSISSQIPFDHSIYIPNSIDHSSNWRSFGNFWTRSHSETHFETYPPYLGEILETSFAPRLATISSISQRASTTFLDNVPWSRILDLRHLKKKKPQETKSDPTHWDWTVIPLSSWG